MIYFMTSREFKQQLQFLVINENYTIESRLNLIEDALGDLLEAFEELL